MSQTVKPYMYLLFGLLVALALFYYFIARPLIAERKVTGIETHNLETKLEEYHESVTLINEFLAARDSLAGVRKRLNAGLYTRDDVLQLIKHIEATANASGVEVREISPSVPDLLLLNSEVATDEIPRELNVSVRFAGSIRNAGRYLERLESDSFYRGLNKLDVFERELGTDPAEYVFHFRALVGTIGESMFSKKDQSRDE